MFEWLDGVSIVPEFSDRGVDCYRLDGARFANRYYIVSGEGTRRLLNTPEVVGYEVYHCLLETTSRMMQYFKEEGLVTSANILSILRGALNYPLEESCYREGIRVHDISFLSSERVFHDDTISGLVIKYSKLAMVPDSTLLIGDIVATGDTLVHCLKYLTKHYRRSKAKLRNIIFFTIGGSTGIEMMERLTADIRKFWPEFEGFITVYYEGIFNTYKEKGVTGLNYPKVDFYWKEGILAPEYRRQTLRSRNVLFEKCVIYDGGARRYEIGDHAKEVLRYWEAMLDRAEGIDLKELTDEKLGCRAPVTYEDWVRCHHYGRLDAELCRALYEQEQEYRAGLQGVTVEEIAEQRIAEIKSALQEYIL